MELELEEYIPRFGDLLDPQDPSKGKYVPFHTKQMDILHSQARFNAAIAGTGGGKTVVGAYWCLIQIQRAILRYGKCTGMIIAPTYKVLSRATVPTFLDATKYTDIEGNWKDHTGYFESKSKYVLPHDWGVIWCQGADNPGGLEGGQFDFVWGDEGGQFKKATFEAITGRTGAKQAPILITTTPYGLGTLYDTWYKEYLNGNTDYNFQIWASVVNPAYPQEEFERAKRRLSPEKFSERYEGKFMQLEGLVYPAFHRCRIQMSSDELKVLLSKRGKIYGGMDFGWNDPFCALLGFLEADTDILYIFYERYKSQTTLEEHANALPKSICGKQPRWAADHNPENIKKLRKGGHNVHKAKKHKKGSSNSGILNGILMCAARMYNGKIKIVENFCPALCEESNLYRYPEKDEEVVGDKPLDEDNHAMDAMRYMVTEIDWKKAA